MFDESLLVESSGASHRTNRGWTTAASLVIQILVIGILAIVPVLYPQALSLVQRPPQIPIFSSAPQPVDQTTIQHSSAAASPQVTLVRSNSPMYGHRIETSDAAPQAPSGFSIPGSKNLVLSSDFMAPLVATPAPTKLVISHPDPASLIHDVKPVYPQPAVMMHLQGTVVLHALISKEGAIESLRVVSGHPFLARAALDAVRQWRYRPYILNGQPVEIETQITVNFKLANE